jgi:NosR/NirI family nitrous oxide reductase transcriptional regulator
VVHERLWALKYLILLGLFAVSLHSLPEAERLAEVEPFKTAITLRFLRDWPFVLYAVALLAGALIVRKLFCRYLCPLGAALTFPGRFRIFDWLRRRKECGHPCQTCAVECEVGAIKPTGEIIANECHYCLDCQVTYWNEHKCPPLVEQRKRRERREQAKRAVREGPPAERAEPPSS